MEEKQSRRTWCRGEGELDEEEGKEREVSRRRGREGGSRRSHGSVGGMTCDFFQRVDVSCSLSTGLGSRRTKVPSGLTSVLLLLLALIKNVASSKRKTAKHKHHQCFACGNECSVIPAHCSVTLTWEDVIGRPGCSIAVCGEPARFYTRFDFFFTFYAGNRIKSFDPIVRFLDSATKQSFHSECLSVSESSVSVLAERRSEAQPETKGALKTERGDLLDSTGGRCIAAVCGWKSFGLEEEPLWRARGLAHKHN